MILYHLQTTRNTGWSPSRVLLHRSLRLFFFTSGVLLLILLFKIPLLLRELLLLLSYVDSFYDTHYSPCEIFASDEIGLEDWGFGIYMGRDFYTLFITHDIYIWRGQRVVLHNEHEGGRAEKESVGNTHAWIVHVVLDGGRTAGGSRLPLRCGGFPRI
jgi:hypothetical protein